MKRGSLHDELENYEESVRDYEFLYKKLKTREVKEALDRGKALLARSKRKNYYKILGIPKTGALSSFGFGSFNSPPCDHCDHSKF